MIPRRRSRARRALPWATVALLAGLIVWSLTVALGERDVVARAERLRTGDALLDKPPDPLAALEILEPWIERHPDDHAALNETATCYQELRAWDKGVAVLLAAAEHAPDDRARAIALTRASDLMMLADRFEEAVALGEQVVGIFPDDLLWRVRLGHLALKGSLSAQQKLVGRFVDPVDKRMRDVAVERAIEAYVTDVWGTPSLDALVAELLPAGDAVIVQHVREEAQAARERFLEAYETLADYPRFGRFDPPVARAWAQCLQRVGRLYDAAIEAGIALREPNLPVGLRTVFHEVKADCAMAIDDPGQAADIHQAIVDEHVAAGAPVPARILWRLYDFRVRAGHWDWIDAHADAYAELHGGDAMLDYARAAALAARGRAAEARDAILEPFAAATLGNRSFTPTSVRSDPERRRAIAMLAYGLFVRLGDSRALSALDGLLQQIPDDVEGLRLRSDLALEQDRLDPAAADAFALLARERRDPADFARWIAVSDRLSVKAFGVTLAERAAGKVDAAERWQRGNEEAIFATYKLLGLVTPGSAMPIIPDQLHLPREPALSWAIVQELLARGRVARARDELRKLSNAHPGVQEFRFQLGKLLVREGLWASASEEFRGMLADLPGDVEVLELAVRTEQALGRTREASRLINAMVLQDPLGVGAVRAVAGLLERDSPQEAARLIERLVRWTDLDQRPDLLALAARAQLQLGRVDEAQTILTALSVQARDNLEVALLALDMGLARGQDGLVDSAVAAIVPLAPGLFPDQMEAVSDRLLSAGLLAELASVFRPEIASLPAARPALRAVAIAGKALGRIDEADDLLARSRGDADADLDRLVLLSANGRATEVALRLRLETPPPARRVERDLLLLVADALSGLTVLVDARPVERLRELGAAGRWDAAELQLLDALLRFLPASGRPAELRPAGALDAPETHWPLAAHDLKPVFARAAADPGGARAQAERLLQLVLMDGRPFWRREARDLAEQALLVDPGLELPRRVLARLALDAQDADAVLRHLQPILAAGRPTTGDLRLVLEASRALDRGEWGMAVAFLHQEDPEVTALIAETLLAWGHPADALDVDAALLVKPPVAPELWRHVIRALSAAGRNDDLLTAIEAARAELPEDREVAEAAAAALAIYPRRSDRALALMESLFAQHPELSAVGEAIARARADDADPAARLAALEAVAASVASQAAPAGAEPRAQLANLLARGARMARGDGDLDLAARLLDEGLALLPADFTLFRELAQLELARGRLDVARRALEMLSFVDLNDRESALALARLDFRQLGQPTRAANVVLRSFGGAMPLEGVEILAAEAFLRGRPRDAINLFYSVGGSPLISAETYLTVARIAYTAGLDDGARTLYDRALDRMPADDPLRARPLYLRNVRLAPAAAAAAVPTKAATQG